MDGNDSIDHSVAPSVTAGASNNIFPQSVKLCQKETAKFNKKYAFTLRNFLIHNQRLCAGKKIYDPKSACREIQDPKSERGGIVTQKK